MRKYLTMNNYQDQHTRWHDRLHGSDNGWIYTAYAKYLMPESFNVNKLEDCYYACKRSNMPLKIDRSPGEQLPPISKDEIIGLVSLGLLDVKMLEMNCWNFCNLDVQFARNLTVGSVFKALRSMYAARKEHFTYLWKNGVEDSFVLLFRLPPWDVYYVKRYSRINKYNTSEIDAKLKTIGTNIRFKSLEKVSKPSMFETVMFYVNMIAVMLKGNRSVRMMLWLQLKDLSSESVLCRLALKFINTESYVKNYFRPEHVFVKAVENRNMDL